MACTIAYRPPEPLPWAVLAGPLAAAEDALARLDERLARSPIRAGWVARSHFADTCASLWLDGALVHPEDLVLHDARMDVRTPTHDLTRAQAVLRARRRIAEAEPDWALSAGGLAALRGRGGENGSRSLVPEADPIETQQPERLDDFGAVDDDFAELFAQVDAAIASAERTLAEGAHEVAQPKPARDPLIYDSEWDEETRLAAWRSAVDETRHLPPTLAAAIALDAWDTLEPLEHGPWLGRLLAAALLRERGKAQTYLPCLNVGGRAVRKDRRWPLDPAGRLPALLEALAAAAEIGLKDHDRWLLARNLLACKLQGRRSTSRLPALLDYVLSRPVVSAGMVAEELGITPRAAQDLVAELGLREATGRGRYRAWGIL